MFANFKKFILMKAVSATVTSILIRQNEMCSI